MRHSPRHLLEYYLLRGFAALICRMPYRIALGFGNIIAWAGFYLIRYRVAEAEKRIRQIFGSEKNRSQVRRIAWRSWRNFIFSCVDLMRIPVAGQEWIKSVVIQDGVSKIKSHVESGRGAIIATIHMGAWEMAALSCLAYGIPLFSIAARQKNLLVDDYMNDLRAQTGFETVLRDSNVAKGIIRRIKAGKVLAILPDVRAPTPALAIRFLGQTANVASGMGFIARQTQIPIFPVVITRVGWGRHRYRVFDPVLPDSRLSKQEDALRITQAVFDIFDRCVRAEPDQWFWFNKRWLFDPLPAACPTHGTMDKGTEAQRGKGTK